MLVSLYSRASTRCANALPVAILLIVVPLLVSGTQVMGQQSNRGNVPQSNANRQQQNTPQLTPEQQREYEKAAKQAYAEHLAQREAELKKAIQPPEGFPLNANQANQVEQVLDYWQQISDQVNQYRCKFQRFDYDSSQVNYRDPQTQMLAAFTVAYGEIRFAASDKASFETSRLFSFKSPPKKPGEQADYEEVEGHSVWGKTIHERWICSGDAVYDFDFVGKRMYETKIPKTLQGNVVESPLPFLFGAKKNDILKRYWVRYVPKYQTNAQGQRELVKDEYWLEAFPKTINDARMYSKVEIVLSAKDFMPVAMHMYSPQYNGKDNFESRYFYFQDRKVNNQIDKLQDAFKVFVRPKLPFGWQAVSRSLGGGSATAQKPTNGQGVR